jgi:hypothetical protein
MPTSVGAGALVRRVRADQRADRTDDERAALMATPIRAPMTHKEARKLLAVFAKLRGVQPRIVQDEAERRKMQAKDKSGHVWEIGDEYIAVEDVLRAR